MRSKIILIMGLLFLMSCEQTPTTLDEVPFVDDDGETTFSAEITAFEFDFFSKSFFFTIKATAPNITPTVSADLIASDTVRASFTLNDSGRQNDINIQDDSFDEVWTLPDSLVTIIDSLLWTWTWTLDAKISAGDEQLALSSTLRPTIPEAPEILSVTHKDTLTLNQASLTFDTLTVHVSHSMGLDEIRDVTFYSLKPDSTLASGGKPIPLFDDGAQTVLYPYGGFDITSGDKVANDGIYSLVLPLSPFDQVGTYNWTFNSRSWEGLDADSVKTSLVVLDAPGSTSSLTTTLIRSGVFQ